MNVKISGFIKKRNELLLTFEKLNDIELLNKIADLKLSIIPVTPEIARIELHKARLFVSGMPKELVERSKKWLLDNGYSLEDLSWLDV